MAVIEAISNEDGTIWAPFCNATRPAFGGNVNALQIIGSTLRARPPAEKAAIVSAFLARFGDVLEGGAIRPVIDRVFPFEQVADAHRLMQSSTHFGKIVLRVSAT